MFLREKRMLEDKNEDSLGRKKYEVPNSLRNPCTSMINDSESSTAVIDWSREEENTVRNEYTHKYTHMSSPDIFHRFFFSIFFCFLFSHDFLFLVFLSFLFNTPTHTHKHHHYQHSPVTSATLASSRLITAISRHTTAHSCM